MNKYDYVKYDPKQVELQKKAKELFIQLEELLEKGIRNIHANEYVVASYHNQELTIRHSQYCLRAEEKLEEAYMYFGKAIRDRQIILGGSSEDVLERDDS